MPIRFVRYGLAIGCVLILAVAQAHAAPPASPRQERLLVGTAPGGVSVEAYRVGTTIRTLVVETLMETGYAIDRFIFESGRLVRLRHQRYGYPTYPRMPDQSVPPHVHLKPGKGDKLLATDVLDFRHDRLIAWTSFGRRQPLTTQDAEDMRTNALARAANYLALMQTALPPGASPDTPWICAGWDGDRCTAFRPE